MWLFSRQWHIRQDLNSMQGLMSATALQVDGLHDQALGLLAHIAQGVSASEQHQRLVRDIAQSMCDIEYNNSIFMGNNSGAAI